MSGSNCRDHGQHQCQCNADGHRLNCATAITVINIVARTGDDAEETQTTGHHCAIAAAINVTTHSIDDSAFFCAVRANTGARATCHCWCGTVVAADCFTCCKVHCHNDQHHHLLLHDSGYVGGDVDGVW